MPKFSPFASLIAATLGAPLFGFAQPAELDIARFAGPDITPSPACLGVAPTGEVYVGVDLNGSLGKAVGKGRIVRLVDKDGDGKVDSNTVYAEVDDPRGIISIGDKLYVLHTVIPKDTGILSGMHLSVFTDANHDGVADGPPKRLVSNISTAKHNQDRGADHTTNGIRLGIDGWIYIAVGDFGFVNAEGTDGTKLTMLGGGVVRVRPDGKEMEIYTHGTRNDYDIAIDPFMNIFSRGNTNDGGGWNIRFIHHIQSAEYGYPLLFKNFTDEMLPALVDLGGGSGTGALFFQEPGWPEKYNNVPMMCDWGRSHLYIHRVTADGASFTQKTEDFIKESQISDVDVDGSGRLYLAAWDGAGYKGNPAKGYISRVTPKGWKYQAFPDLKKATVAELIKLLQGPSATARVYASQELLARPADASWKEVAALAMDKKQSLEARVAAIFTYKQLRGAEATDGLVKLAADPAVREWALRSLTDRKTQLAKVPSDPLLAGLKDASPRVQAAAAVALGRLGKVDAAPALIAISNPPPSVKHPVEGTDGPHATPNSPLVVPHVAVRNLVALNAIDAAVNAVGTANSDGALWTLRYLHDEKAVEGLIKKFATVTDATLGDKILGTLIRLYQQETPYDGSYWWSTRPDSRGPYYKPMQWTASSKIAAFIKAEHDKANPERKALIEMQCRRNRAAIPGLNIVIAEPGDKKKNEPKVDLAKIAQQAGELGKISIEDVMLALDKMKGDPKVGEKLFTRQGCVACHTLKATDPMKGPFMGQVGSILKKEQIAESILKPNASISQGFATVQIETKDKAVHVGFVSGQTADSIEMRDITGRVWSVKSADVSTRKELEVSMMPEGLVNALSLQEFVSLVSFLEGQKK